MGSLFFLLGADTTQTDILIITDNTFQVTKLDTLPDPTVVGYVLKITTYSLVIEIEKLKNGRHTN